MHFRTLWTHTGLCHARASRAARALTPGWALTQRRGASVVGGHGCGGSVEEPSRCLGIMAAEGMAAERLPTCRDAGAEAGLARGFSVLLLPRRCAVRRGVVEVNVRQRQEQARFSRPRRADQLGEEVPCVLRLVRHVGHEDERTHLGLAHQADPLPPVRWLAAGVAHLAMRRASVARWRQRHRSHHQAACGRVWLGESSLRRVVLLPQRDGLPQERCLAGPRRAE
eukprot:scaffold23565_cov71-Phaeocystis_antarctica.AAC.9